MTFFRPTQKDITYSSSTWKDVANMIGLILTTICVFSGMVLLMTTLDIFTADHPSSADKSLATWCQKTTSAQLCNDLLNIQPQFHDRNQIDKTCTSICHNLLLTTNSVSKFLDCYSECNLLVRNFQHSNLVYSNWHANIHTTSKYLVFISGLGMLLLNFLNK